MSHNSSLGPSFEFKLGIVKSSSTKMYRAVLATAIIESHNLLPKKKILPKIEQTNKFVLGSWFELGIRRTSRRFQIFLIGDLSVSLLT